MQNKNKEIHDKILKEVKRVEFSVRKIMSGVSLGVKNSTFRGQGMTFSDIRAYTPGDDIRNFAWQVMAKTGQPFVKEFEEERDLEVHVALDAGASMRFGGKYKSKKTIQAYVLAFLGLSTSKTKDKFGGIVFSSRQLKRIPIMRGEDNVRRALYSYLEEGEKHKNEVSNLNVALEYFSKIRSKNCICILVSDFATPIDRKLLARVKSRHQVKLVFISDPYEKNFPNAGLLSAVAPSFLKKALWVKGSEATNHKLLEEFNKRKSSIEKICKSFGVSFIDQSTQDEDLREMTKTLKLRNVYG
ncbi:MAG: DUF58 domain-containing protein [Bdellovibrionales bacterium]